MIAFYAVNAIDRQKPIELTYSGDKVMIVSDLAIPDNRPDE